MPAIHTTSKQKPTKPSKPIVVGIQDTQQNAPGSLLGDLAYLSISNQPFFNQFVPVQHWPNKDFVKKPEYQYLHQLPAELLQDIESEPLESPKLPDHAIIDNFRKVYDDFHTRIRGTSTLTGKKKVPETRPYVLFLMVYDLCKREAKRLALQEVEVSVDFVWTFEHETFNRFERKNGWTNCLLSNFCIDTQGYTPALSEELHGTSSYSPARQLYTLFMRLLDQKSISAKDFHTRSQEIMIGNLDISWPIFSPIVRKWRFYCVNFIGSFQIWLIRRAQ